MSSRSWSPGSGERLCRPVLVGQVIAPHGVRGEVSVEVYSDVAQRFAPGSRLQASVGDGPGRSLEVAASRPHKGRRLVVFCEIETRDDAEALRGARLEIQETEVPEPPQGHYYFFQLEGCRCLDRQGGEIGVVEEVVEGGGGILLLLRSVDGARLPVPFVESIVGEVDLSQRSITVDLPEGLLEACGSG